MSLPSAQAPNAPPSGATAPPTAPSFDPPVNLSIGGQRFALKQSVAAEVPLFLARFGGRWTPQAGESDEWGWVVKGVRGDMFSKLVTYIEKQSIEKKFELKRTAHPVVEGKNRQEYLHMLEYLGFEKCVVEEARGCLFSRDDMPAGFEGVYIFSGDGKSLYTTNLLTDLDGAIGLTCAQKHTPGGVAECRVQFSKPKGVQIGSADEDEETVPLYAQCVLWGEGRSVPHEDKEEEHAHIGMTRHELHNVFGVDVDESGRVFYILEGTGGDSDQIYVYTESRVKPEEHFCFNFACAFGPAVSCQCVCATLLPPKDADILVV